MSSVSSGQLLQLPPPLQFRAFGGQAAGQRRAVYCPLRGSHSSYYCSATARRDAVLNLNALALQATGTGTNR